MKQISSFLSNAVKWISAAECSEPHSIVSAISPVPCVSSVSTGPVSSDTNANVPDADDVASVSSRRSSRSSRSNVSSSPLICAEAERAALLAKAVGLQEKLDQNYQGGAIEQVME